MGLRRVRDHSRHRVSHRLVLRLYWKQTELHIRVPDGWKIHVGSASYPVTAGQLHVGDHAAWHAGRDGGLWHTVLDHLGVLYLRLAARRLRLHSSLLSTSTYKRIRGITVVDIRDRLWTTFRK